MYNILLVEDDKDIQLINSNMLKRYGSYNVYPADCLDAAREIAANVDLHLVVLDIMLPDGSGLDFLAELKRESEIPVLLLTALSETSDEINCLRAGGDDYLSKPYDIEVLMLRIETLLRRTDQIPKALTKGLLTLDLLSNRALIGEENLELRQKEFDILFFLALNENKTFSAELIYERVWAQKMKGNDNAVKTVMSRLRKKLTGSGYTIATKRGVGYCFEKIA